MAQQQSGNQPFFHQFKIENGKSVCLSEISEKDIAEAANFTAHIFTLINPLYVHLKISQTEAVPYFTEIIKRCVAEKMAFKAYDHEKILFVFLAYDVFNIQIEPLDFSKVSPKVLIIPEMHKQLGPKLSPKKTGEMLCMALMATHLDYLGSGITLKSCKIIAYKNPMMRAYPKIYSLFTSPASSKIGFLAGFKTLKFYHPKNYVNEKGEKPFETIEETVNKLGLKDYEGVFAGLRESHLKPKL